MQSGAITHNIIVIESRTSAMTALPASIMKEKMGPIHAPLLLGRLYVLLTWEGATSRR